MKTKINLQNLLIILLFTLLGIAILGISKIISLLTITNPQMNNLQLLQNPHIIGIAILATTSATILIWLNHRITTDINQPTKQMSYTIEQASLGHYEQRINHQEYPELNNLSLACNRLIENLEAVTNESKRRINEERQMTSLLIESFHHPSIILNPTGTIIQANNSARLLFTSPNGNDALGKIKQAFANQQTTFTCNSITYEINYAKTMTQENFSGQLLHFYQQRNLKTTTKQQQNKETKK